MHSHPAGKNDSLQVSGVGGGRTAPTLTQRLLAPWQPIAATPSNQGTRAGTFGLPSFVKDWEASWAEHGCAPFGGVQQLFWAGGELG